MRRTWLCLILLIGLTGAAGCPAMSPVGSPSNPAGIASPEKSNSGSTTSSGTSGSGDLPEGIGSISGTSGSGTGAPPPPPGPPNGGTGATGTSVAMENGGSTFCPKGDNEAMGDDQMKDATDWRLRFGINAWWELSRTTPDIFPVFKNFTTDLQMKLEFKSRECDSWLLAWSGPILNGNPVVHMVYQPKDQSAEPAKSFTVGDAQPEGQNVWFLGLTLGEGTVTFTVDYAGVTHSLGSFTTYYSDVNGGVMSAPIFLNH